MFTNNSQSLAAAVKSVLQCCFPCRAHFYSALLLHLAPVEQLVNRGPKKRELFFLHHRDVSIKSNELTPV